MDELQAQRIVVSDEEFEMLLELLEEPTTDAPKLRKLFAMPRMFTRDPEE